MESVIKSLFLFLPRSIWTCCIPPKKKYGYSIDRINNQINWGMKMCFLKTKHYTARIIIENFSAGASNALSIVK